MKCPICGNELKVSKKNPDYVLCHNCRKKFRLPKKKKENTPAAKSTIPETDSEMTDRTQVFSRKEVRAALRKANEERKAKKAAGISPKPPVEADDGDDMEYHFRYANIPPKEIRQKQEQEMRKAYDELLSIGKEERTSKKRGLFRRKK